MPTDKRIADLLEHFDYEIVGADASASTLADLVDDTREIANGEWFLARNGHTASGTDFAREAIALGASGIITAEQVDVDAPQIVIADLSSGLNELYEAIYPDYKSVRLVGVTGTDGKTSVAMMLATAIAAIEGDCGISGTIQIGSVRHPKVARLTTPSNLAIKRWLHGLAHAGCQTAVMEVSSHALDQDRLSGVSVNVGVLTNIARDHLDYHGTIEAYREAKAKLFVNERSAASVLDITQPEAQSIAQRLDANRVWPIGSDKTKIEQSFDSAKALTIDTHSYQENGLYVSYSAAESSYVFELPLVGDFQYKNIAMVVQVMRALGYEAEAITKAVSQIKPIDGRMQIVEHSSGPMVLVDYSHTAQAISNALAALRPLAQLRGGDLQIVFGCGGDRDSGKRPEMACAAVKGADKTMITSDNPRTEDPQHIIQDILRGLSKPDAVCTIVDRREAIAQIIKQANMQDVILIAGKGHETYQEINGQRYPFSDYTEAKLALEEFWK